MIANIDIETITNKSEADRSDAENELLNQHDQIDLTEGYEDEKDNDIID